MDIFNHLKSFVKDSLIYGLSSVVTKFISFFLIPLYTAFITPHEYGIYGLINNTFILLNILLVFALDNSTARWIYDTDNEQEKKRTINTWLWFYLIVSIAATILIFVFQDFLSGVILKDKTHGRLLCIMMAALPLNCFITVANNVLRFIRKPAALLFITIFQSLLLISLNFISVKVLKWGLEGIFLGTLISYFFSALVSIVFIRKWLSWPPSLDRKRLKQMIAYGWPFVPAGVSIWLVSVSGAFFLNYFLDQKQVGLFQLGSSFASVLAVFVAAFQQAWMPFAFSIMRQENAGRIYASVLYMYTCLMSLLCVGFSLFSKEILHLLVSPAYYDAAPVVTILAYNYLFAGLLSIANLGPGIVKKTKPLGIVMFLSAILIVIFNFVLIPLFGKEGAALATCLSQVIAVIILFTYSQRLYFIPYNFKAVILIICLSLLLWFCGLNLPVHTASLELVLKASLCLILGLLIVYLQRKRTVFLLRKLFLKKKFII